MIGQKLRHILLIGIILPLHGILTADAPEQKAYATSMFSGLIDIGGGRKMHFVRQGTGSPTVVFVSGRSDRADIWLTSADHAKPGTDVFSEVAKFTQAFAYDRPGTVTITPQNDIKPSRSTKVLQPVTPKNGVEDLHAVLMAAKIPGPYVLVGHSYGGLIVRLFASTYPNEVSGLVLIDVVTELFYDALSPAQQALWNHLNSNYSPDLDHYTIQERTDFRASFEQLRAAPALQEMPVIVLSSDRPYDFQLLIAKGVLPTDTPLDFGPRVFQAQLQGQERLASLLKAKFISHTHAGHYIQLEQPQLVIEAIKEIVDKVRKA